jgi:hypothetical protein
MNNTIDFTVASVNANKSVVLNARYTSLFVNVSSNDVQTTINTDGSDSSDVFNQLFRKLINRNFSFTMQTDGSISNISGLDDIMHTAESSLPSKLKPEEKEALTRLINNLFGTEAFQNNFVQWLPHYIGHGVNIGDSWPDNYHISGTMGGNMTTLWKLEYGDRYGVKLSSQGKLMSDRSALVDLGGGAKGNVDVSGAIQGNYLVDPVTGWPTQCIQHTEVKGKYIYKAGYVKTIKRNVEVPVSMISNVQYKIVHLQQ